MENNFTLQICGHVYNPGAHWKKYHFYLTNRIHYIFSGTVYYKGIKKLKKNHLYIFPANPDFNVEQSDKDPVDHIYFDFISHQTLKIKDYIEIDVRDIDGLPELLESAGKNLTLDKVTHSLGSNYFNILMELIKNRIPLFKFKSHFTQDAIQYIHQHNFDELSVKNIAEKLNVNVDHFIRCFKNDTGLTPHKYINLYKADMATTFLNNGKSVKETASLLGFASSSSFSTFYKTVHIS